MAKKFLTKTLAILVGAMMLFGSANAVTFMSNSADGQPPRLNEDTTLSDIYQAVEFAPVSTGSQWSYNYGKYNDMFEWNGYLFGMANLGETNTGSTYNFAEAHIDVWDITGGETGTLYTSWTAQQLGMTNTPIEETRPNQLLGIYVDDNYIYVSAYFGEGNRGMIFIYENKIGQEGGEAVPARLGSEDVLNDNTKVQSFVPSAWAGNGGFNWTNKSFMGKINNYLIGFKTSNREIGLNRYSVLDVSDPSKIGEWTAQDRFETDVFTFKTLNGEDKTNGSLQDIEFVDKYVYAVGYDSSADNKAEWMNIVDFSVPEEPVIVGRLAFASELYDGENQNSYRFLTVSGDYAYVTTSDDATGKMQYLYVIDISDKTNPRLISKSTASKEAGGNELGGIKVSWNKDGTEYYVSNLTGMSHVSVFGDTLVGLAGKNRTREIYMIRLSSDKTDMEQVAVRTSNAYEGFNQWESGITGEIRNTMVYGNKIYYNIKAELRQYRIGYVELNPELVYGIEMQSLPTNVSSDDGYVVKGEFYDGSAGTVTDSIKVSLINAAGEAVSEEEVWPDFGYDGQAYIGTWEYELPTDVPSGKYTLRAEAARSYEPDTDVSYVDLTAIYDESEFNYTTSVAEPEFTVEASFNVNEGTVTASISAENADEAFVPVLALYSSADKLEAVDVGDETQTTANLSVSGYTNGKTVKVMYFKSMSTATPVYPAAIYPAQ